MEKGKPKLGGDRVEGKVHGWRWVCVSIFEILVEDKDDFAPIEGRVDQQRSFLPRFSLIDATPSPSSRVLITTHLTFSSSLVKTTTLFIPRAQ